MRVIKIFEPLSFEMSAVKEEEDDDGTSERNAIACKSGTWSTQR